MSISPGEAATALDDIERTERRTRVAGGYAHASPHLVVWGLVWMLGYGSSAILPPERWGLVWLPLTVLGTLGSMVFGRRAGGFDRPGAVAKPVTIGLAIGLFIGCVYYVFRTPDPLPYLIFPALVMGLVYTCMGAIAGMARFVWIGATLFLLTMAGYLLAPQWMAAWIALVGGGGLVVGGLWLRRA